MSDEEPRMDGVAPFRSRSASSWKRPRVALGWLISLGGAFALVAEATMYLSEILAK